MLLRLNERGLKHGVPTLVKAWTVQIDRVYNLTALRQPEYILHHLGEGKQPEIRIQCRLLLEPVGFPLESFACIQELLSVLIDIVDGESCCRCASHEY